MNSPERTPPGVAPSGPSARFVMACFLIGVLCFVGGIGLVYVWFGNARPQSSLGWTVAPGADPGDESALSARELAARQASSRNSVQVYFTADGATLQGQTYSLTKPLSPHERLRFAVETLLSGPASENYSSAVPANTKLRAAYLVQKDLVVLDLSGDIRSQVLGGPMAEWLCAQAIVNTVTDNLPDVRRVQILIDGQMVPILWGNVDLSVPLLADNTLRPPAL
ncbi:MAG TPA: GerMN domain-containing protein [Candidatus Sumerlaeota bacterium]|nr:GerMN domain-containing protein [Candidatus Sumerlaeota bacterium]HPS02972.1 GerMN domain-containing protein [Candidatus Sumerlaeota bacterium]